MKFLIPQMMIARIKLKKIGFLSLILCTSLLLVFTNSNGQQPTIRATVNKDTILIGEPLSMDIHVALPEGKYQITWPDTSVYLNKFILTNPDGPIDSSKNGTEINITKRIYITNFDSGTQVVPAIPIKIEDISTHSVLNAATDSITVEVAYAPDDGVQPFHDIKSIISVKNTPFGWLKYLIPVLLAGIIAFLFFYLRKRRKKIPSLNSTLRPPYQEAMEAIAQLRSEIETDGTRSHKEYFNRLIWIFRKYLTRTKEENKMALTPIELINDIHEQIEEKDLFTHIANVISLSEAVLFAKFTTDKKALINSIEQIKTGIDYFNKKEAK